MSMTLPTPEAAEETRKFIKKAGGDSTWDRLAEYLAKESTGKEQFVINRTGLLKKCECFFWFGSWLVGASQFLERSNWRL